MLVAWHYASNRKAIIAYIVAKRVYFAKYKDDKIYDK